MNDEGGDAFKHQLTGAGVWDDRSPIGKRTTLNNSSHDDLLHRHKKSGEQRRGEAEKWVRRRFSVSVRI